MLKKFSQTAPAVLLCISSHIHGMVYECQSYNANYDVSGSAATTPRAAGGNNKPITSNNGDCMGLTHGENIQDKEAAKQMWDQLLNTDGLSYEVPQPLIYAINVLAGREDIHTASNNDDLLYVRSLLRLANSESASDKIRNIIEKVEDTLIGDNVIEMDEIYYDNLIAITRADIFNSSTPINDESAPHILKSMVIVLYMIKACHIYKRYVSCEQDISISLMMDARSILLPILLIYNRYGEELSKQVMQLKQHIEYNTDWSCMQ